MRDKAEQLNLDDEEDEALERAWRKLYPESTENSFCPTGPGGGVDATCSPGDKSKHVGEKVGHKEIAYSAQIERDIAKSVKGDWEKDNKFYDVRTADGKHFIEVKSRLKGKKDSITVHDDALLRKVNGVKDNPGSTFHTVVVDKRDEYEGGAHADKYSGHGLYYKRGSGRYTPGQMHPVKSVTELNRLIRAPDHLLPERAKGSLPKGSEVKELERRAERDHTARLKKDRERKARLKAEGKSAYERQT